MDTAESVQLTNSALEKEIKSDHDCDSWEEVSFLTSLYDKHILCMM